MKLMEHPDAVGEVFNVGSTEEVSITTLAQRIRAITGSQSEIAYIPYGEAYEQGFEDMPRRVPDTSKVRELIGFTPQTSLDQIIQQVVSYFTAVRSGGPAEFARAPRRRFATATPAARARPPGLPKNRTPPLGGAEGR